MIMRTGAMRRIYPRYIQDKFRLSKLLEQLLHTLETSPLQVKLRMLSYDCQIPEPIFIRMASLYRQPEDAGNVEASDFHIVFSNVLFRYPTVKIFEQPDGSFFFAM